MRIAGVAVRLAVACALLACSKPATQLVGVVETDIPPAAYGCVGVVASRVEGGVVVPGDRRLFEVPELVTLPFSFGVAPPDGDASRRVELTADAWPTCADAVPGAAPIVSRTVRTGFLPEQSLRVVLFLADRCRDVRCPANQTCDVETGACVDIPDIAPEDLAPTRPGDELGRDGGAGGGLDAGPRDGGPAGPTVDMLAVDWVLQGLEIPAASDPTTRITGVAATGTGGVVVAGFTSDAANFGVDVADSMPISSGGSAIFVAKVSLAGAIEWLRVIQGALAVATLAVAGDAAIVTGPFQGSASFGAFALTAVDTQDSFAAALDLATGTPRWATAFGVEGQVDRGVGGVGTAAGVLVSARGAAAGPVHVNGMTPGALEGAASPQGVLLYLDPATGAVRRAIGLGGGALEALTLASDGAGGALIGHAASGGRVTGLHPPVAGGGPHELAVTRLDGAGAWAWTTYLEGCTDTASVRVERNAGAAWLAFTDAGCGTIPTTIAGPGGSRAGTPLDPAASGSLLVTVGLGALDGAPVAGSLRAVTLHPTGGTVYALAADASDALYVGGFMGLPAGGATLDFGGGPTLFERNMAGTVQSNGAAFLWSRGADGAFRGVDSWSNGGAGSILAGESDAVTGIALDPTGITFGGWLHGLGFVGSERIGGGTGFDVGFLVHAR